MQTEYAISTKTHSAADILAGVVNGTLRAWRTDVDKVVWYQKAPAIHGGPAAKTGDPTEGVEPADEELADD